MVLPSVYTTVPGYRHSNSVSLFQFNRNVRIYIGPFGANSTQKHGFVFAGVFVTNNTCIPLLKMSGGLPTHKEIFFRLPRDVDMAATISRDHLYVQ